MDGRLTNVIVAILSGGLAGGVITALVSWTFFQEDIGRKLLTEILAIKAQKGGWILEGRDYKTIELSDKKELGTEHGKVKNWLYNVEIRVVLDEGEWIRPVTKINYFKFIDGQRTWIVRNKFSEKTVRKGANPGDYHPALLSSAAIQELCGWIERVASARRTQWYWPFKKLSDHGLYMLRSTLDAVVTEDRIWVFAGREQTALTDEAKIFLKEYLDNDFRKRQEEDLKTKQS